MNINSKTQICIIIGDPIIQSYSPIMHNAAYHEMDITDKFVFVASKVESKDLKKTLEVFKKLNIRGITCTIPHKEEVIKFLDYIDPIAAKIGAVNTIVNENNFLKGYNTDWIGIAQPLSLITNVFNKNVSIIGAGGAARASVYALNSLGAKITIFNRSLKNAQILAEEFDCKFSNLEGLKKLKDYDIIINSTSVGMKENESIVKKEYLDKKHIVFDNVYKKDGTKLYNDAKNVGARVISGTEMLLYQGFEQFKLYTGLDAPQDIMRKALTKALNI